MKRKGRRGMNVGSSPTELLDYPKLHGAKWKPGDAVSWMSLKSLFENRLHMLRATTLRKIHRSLSVIALWMSFSKQDGCREQGINFPLHTLDL